MTTPAEIEQQLIALIQSAILKKVDPEVPLLESGLLDSVAAVELMLSVESRFGCTVPITEAQEHLYSVRTLTDFVVANTAA
ncbi:acyl carrier protein [Pseudacidovorax sp. RU35E]|uniref:acyl carrier protein n=1 Tax=Pseudacidovorax sp. RU35E TaxID=1907403 RepID=UPI0009557528|nr:phosphopantetheine-binding protein [Pseudacidovorax sp. RU35E]SIR40214.1 D-alanine--poly(phosphoribitol) ligase subunit 2 [Pseudacidovorax sp. RU35E]